MPGAEQVRGAEKAAGPQGEQNPRGRGAQIDPAPSIPPIDPSLPAQPGRSRLWETSWVGTRLGPAGGQGLGGRRKYGDASAKGLYKGGRRPRREGDFLSSLCFRQVRPSKWTYVAIQS